MKRQILIVTGRYLPGYKDGGPVRTIKNITDRLGDEYDFFILTADRDHGDEQPYPDIREKEWNQVGKAQVYYVPPHGFTSENVLKCAQNKDLIYMCGCFNDYARTVLRLKRVGKISSPVVIASMGLFSPGAFRIKYAKKKAYVMLLRLLGLFGKVEWSATSKQEVSDIRREVGKKAICHVAEDLPRCSRDVPLGGRSSSGSLRVIFLSRISRKKNLSYVARILQECGKYRIDFDIYGNQEDLRYWEECEAQLQKLPDNISWRYCGEADAEKVPEIFAQYEVFLFPTTAENYGHVILESLMGGCIPVISDQTPWTEEKMGFAGTVCPLSGEGKKEELRKFADTIMHFAELDEEEKKARAMKCQQMAQEYDASAAEDAYRNMFNGK